MTLDISAVETRIKGRLAECKERLHESRVNLDFYRGHFKLYRYRVPDSPSDLCNRSSLITQHAVNVLTSYLYRDNPVRQIKGQAGATDFLQKVYNDNKIWALMQAADKLSMLASGGAVAFQVAGTDDPDSPIKIHLHPGHAFEVIVSDDDPLKVEAVITIDRQGDRDRWNLWTADEYRIYLSPRKDAKAKESKEIEMVERGDNPYGVLPFSFAHYTVPTFEFFSGSPGNTLREVNAYVIYRLTELADAIKYMVFPRFGVVGASADWKPPSPWRPGDFAPLPSIPDGTDGTKAPQILTVQAPAGFVGETWTDLDKYIDHALAMAGVPMAVTRLIQSVARSGESIAQEQAPLVTFAKGRQRAWLGYETDLAKLVLQVATAHLGNHQIDRPELTAALADFQLSMRWAPYYSALPGPERDRADKYAIDNGYSSILLNLEEREGCTREEAVARLERIAKDKLEEAEILGTTPPGATQAPAGATQDPGVTPVADSDDTQDEEPEPSDANTP